jgi:hypothetical protein
MAKTTQETEIKTKLSISSKIALTFVVATSIVVVGSVLFSAAYIGLINKLKSTEIAATTNAQTVNQDQTFQTQ